MNAKVTKINKVVIEYISHGSRVKVEIENGEVTSATVTKVIEPDMPVNLISFEGLTDLRGLHEALTKVLVDAEHYCERQPTP